MAGSLDILLYWFSSRMFINVTKSLFPSRESNRVILVTMFLLLAGLNLASLVCYRYAVTTTLRFNLFVALRIWGSSVLVLSIKIGSASAVLPVNSPWYLIPFLAVVELVSISVRPVTLCFRLLANIRAGHILLTLICKIEQMLWVLGVLFGVLELMVSIVQAFVFLILVRVYLDEAIRH